MKKPCVSEIESCTYSLDQPLTLGCDIKGFYPPNISVTWLKLRAGEQDDQEDDIIEGGDVWGPIQTSPMLYRATATLKSGLTKEDKGVRGGGIMCRVEHCSLEKPIERCWRSDDVGTYCLFMSTLNGNIKNRQSFLIIR